MRVSSLSSLLPVLILAVLAGCNGDDDDDDDFCVTATEDCPCSSQGKCNPGLVCEEEVCVEGEEEPDEPENEGGAPPTIPSNEGQLGYPCFEDGTCASADLECRSGMCVRASDSGD